MFMKQLGHMDVVNLVGIVFVEGGKSLQLEVVDSLPPHNTTFLTFKNTFSVMLHQTRDEGFPFIICELTWRSIAPEEKGRILADLAYPFFDSKEDPLIQEEQLIITRLEGAICGTILSEEVIIQI